ncbi:hypothetical protein M3Y95_00295800 [Aphelenchoides besseyi]|nr:hypothetical protein M3Y95_00295800 [Aphelenchoides besseyi]
MTQIQILLTLGIVVGSAVLASNSHNSAFQIVQPLGYASFNGAPDPLPSNDTNRPDGMIVRCYKTLCRDWLHECHWFCDKGKSWRCMECLSWRGQHCYDCFKLL